MSHVYDALVHLAPATDPELLDGYRRYEAELMAHLTPEQLETYARLIERTGTVRIVEEMSTDEVAALNPEEASVMTAIMADTATTMENRRVAALLNQRGQHDHAPDLQNQPPHP